MSSKRRQRPPAQSGRTVTIGPVAIVAVAAIAVLGVLGIAMLRRADPAPVAGVTGGDATAPVGGVTGIDATGAANEGSPSASTQAPGQTVPPAQAVGVTAAGDPFLGSPEAPVAIIEYSDYQCPNCRQFAREVMPWLKDSWLSQGFVRIEYRDFAIRGEASYRAAEAAHCAGEQGEFWPYHDALFAAGPAESEPFARPELERFADELGLDAGRFAECLDSGRHRARVEASTAEATRRGFQGTPTYEINGRVTAGAIPIERWNELFVAYRSEIGP